MICQLPRWNSRVTTSNRIKRSKHSDNATRQAQYQHSILRSDPVIIDLRSQMSLLWTEIRT